MDTIVKKYQQKFRKVKDEMCRWEELQSRLISQFSNASSIIQREEFHLVVSSLQKIVCDSKQLVRMGSSQLNPKQLKLRVGIKPTLTDCLDGLKLLEEMHQAEYHLKLSIVSALPALTLNPRASGDLAALQQLLVDQPNIPQEEVQLIYDIVFAEEIS